MNMKDQILAALREQFDDWERPLASLIEEQITTPPFDFGWSIADVMAHLWAWQQISITRIEAGVQDRGPEYPKWIVESVENWRNGFLQSLELGNQISERDQLDGDRYSWLKSYSLAAILITSFDHHQVHREKVMDWPPEYEN